MNIFWKRKTWQAKVHNSFWRTAQVSRRLSVQLALVYLNNKNGNNRKKKDEEKGRGNKYEAAGRAVDRQSLKCFTLSTKNILLILFEYPQLNCPLKTAFNLSPHIINTIQMSTVFTNLSFFIRNRTSERSEQVCFLIDTSPIVRKHRTRVRSTLWIIQYMWIYLMHSCW